MSGGRRPLLTRKERVGAAVVTGLLLLPVPFALAGSDVALRGLFLLAGSATFLVLVNLAARLSGGKVPLLLFAAVLGVVGFALSSAFPSFVIEGGEVRPRQWPEFFRGLAYSIGLTPLAVYERTTMFRKTPGRRRDNPPKG